MGYNQNINKEELKFLEKIVREYPDVFHLQTEKLSDKLNTT